MRKPGAAKHFCHEPGFTATPWDGVQGVEGLVWSFQVEVRVLSPTQTPQGFRPWGVFASRDSAGRSGGQRPALALPVRPSIPADAAAGRGATRARAKPPTRRAYEIQNSKISVAMPLLT